MGIANRRSASQFIVSLSVGVALGGCAQATKPVADAKPAPPKVETAGAMPPTTAGPNDSNVVVDSVNDNVSRVDAILRRRAIAQQLADDVRTQRESRGADVADPATPTTKPEAGAEIERLAAEIRALQDRAAAAAIDRRSVASADAENAASGTIATPTQVEIKRDGKSVPAVDHPPAVDPLAAIDARFTHKLAEDPKSLDAQLSLQLVHFLKNDPVPAADDLAPLPNEDKELLSTVCDALSNFRNVVRASPNPMTSEKARPFVDMADRIRSRADLNISNASLCTKVSAFGNYDPIDPLKFPAGQPGWAVFYCEVDGFQSTLDDKQLWGTKLSLGLKLYDVNGFEVWRQEPDQVTDSSRRRRRDFFIAKKIQLPSTLAPGRYLLKVSVRDLQGNRVDESTLQVDVVAK